MARLTPFEKLQTREALDYAERHTPERREAERISLLAGHWEAMAVQAAMRAAAEGRAERQER